jgi:tartrate-resistant acid phosphatase type 5
MTGGKEKIMDYPVSRRAVMGGIAAATALAPLGVVRAQRAAALNFLVVGDWGRDGAQHQRDVAAQMGKTAAERGSHFKSAQDPQWKTSFEDIYTHPALQTPWYVALGNHDYRGVPQAQIDYAALSPRWKMPSRYYKLAGADLGAPHVDIFVIDSSPLVHRYSDKVEAPIAHNVGAQDVDAQLAWLDRELAASQAPWKLVTGHHTIRSGGSGHGDTPELVALVKPLLEKHGVQAYINGHDHDLQHIRDGQVDYICAGAGSEVRPVKPIAGTLFCVARSGFAAIALDADTLALEFLDYEGGSLYRAAISRERKALSSAA